MKWILVGLLAATMLAGCGSNESASGGGEGASDASSQQIEQAREIGFEQCDEPLVDPQRAESDPVGYAEERFGGPDEFDQAREAGCLEALREG